METGRRIRNRPFPAEQPETNGGNGGIQGRHRKNFTLVILLATVCTYDEYATIAENGFVRADHIFIGWATEENGAVFYQPGEAILNLSAAQNGLVALVATENPTVDSREATIAHTSTFLRQADGNTLPPQPRRVRTRALPGKDTINLVHERRAWFNVLLAGVRGNVVC